MATVYLAEDLRHKRKVAVKVLRPELAAVLGADRFVQEITTTANLQHPHILPLFDSGEADSFLYYVMPFIDGETLRDKLNREKQLGIDEAVKITTELADALDYAHRHKVIHRDIKPENILLHDGRPVMADFGIALAVSAAAGGRMTETGLSLGTPHYMSPEQATAEKDLTSRSDGYSLDCVLYEMLTGEPPHMGTSAQQIIMKIVTDDARPVTELRKSVPPNVTAAVAKALEKLAADRFARAVEFAEALTNPETLTGNDSRVAVSPDGSRWVYIGPGEPGRQLWVRHRDQLHATPLPGTQGAADPFFSPDGSHVGFRVGRNVWRVVSLGGGPPLTVADSGIEDTGGSWGSDGYLYFDGAARLGNGLVRVRVRVPEGGGAPEAVTVADTEQGEFSHLWPEALPGRRGVVFTVRRGNQTNFAVWDIAVADLATGTHTVLVRGVRARYATSGHLVYVTADGTLMAVPFDEGTLAVTGDAVALAEGLRVGFLGNMDLALSATGTLVYTTGSVLGSTPMEMVWVTRDGTATEIHPEWTGNFTSPRLSPAGTQLAVAIRANNETQIWIKQLDRGPLPKLTFEAPANFRPAWTPDGGNVAFVSNRGDDPDLYVRRADGTGQAELLLDAERAIREVTYSPDGEWIVYQEGGFPEADLYAVRTSGETLCQCRW